MVKQVKKCHYTSTITENRQNGKQLWKTIKTLLPSKAHHSTKEVIVDGKSISDSKEVANEFNNIFVEMGQKLAQGFNQSCNQGNYPEHFTGVPLKFVKIEEEFVLNNFQPLVLEKLQVLMD